MPNHQKTLEAIFRDPAPAHIKWRDIESMLTWLGAEVEEGSGSRVRIMLRDKIITFHRPHPRPESKRGQVRAVRRFLEDVEIQP